MSRKKIGLLTAGAIIVVGAVLGGTNEDDVDAANADPTPSSKRST
jgi:hypothetical protein